VTSHTLIFPAAQGSANSYLRNNGAGALSWSAAGGDVGGPASATDNAVARFDATTGKLLQSSGVTVSDAADIAGARTLALSGATSGVLTLQPAATTTNHTLTLPAAQGAAGSVLQNNGSGSLSWAAAAGGGLINIQRFTASGTYTPTAGTTRALVYVTGGGGAGGGVTTGANNAASAGGNGGGTYVALVSINSASTGTITIGAGATGGTGAGARGDSSTFLFPSTGTPNASVTGAGGYGGGTDTSAADENFSQANTNDASGSASGALLVAGYGIEGSRGLNGISIINDVAMSGAGGRSKWAEGGRPVVQNNTNGRTNGISGNSGSGGSGAVQTNNSQTGTGGNGGDGVVVVYEY
jgi:hypothetical protein